jgi:hypothetical protein
MFTLNQFAAMQKSAWRQQKHRLIFTWKENKHKHDNIKESINKMSTSSVIQRSQHKGTDCSTDRMWKDEKRVAKPEKETWKMKRKLFWKVDQTHKRKIGSELKNRQWSWKGKEKMMKLERSHFEELSVPFILLWVDRQNNLQQSLSLSLSLSSSYRHKSFWVSLLATRIEIDGDKTLRE